MRGKPIVQMVIFGLVATAIGLVAAFLIPWFPTEGSRQAGNIHTLYHVLLVASVPVFVIVETVVIFAVWRFRMRPGEELKDGPPIHGNTRLEVVWTVAPVLLIIGLCAYSYSVLRSNEQTKPRELTINVTARQFAFEFSYPNAGHGQVVSNVLYMPLNRPVVFKIRSLDVVHSFFVPNFSEKLDAVPGITTTLRVTATRIGSYSAECTELCGAGHSLMRGPVRVVSPSQFQSWLQSQKSTTAPPLGIPTPLESQPGVPGSTGAGATSGGSSGPSSTGTTGGSSSSGASLGGNPAKGAA